MSFYSAPRLRPTLPPVTVGDRSMKFGDRFWIMGVINVTPDSFSDGGDFFDGQRAVEHALELVEHGADIVDIGGESTRPGAEPVSVSEEIERVVPVIEAIDAQSDAIISIDTTKAAVAERAIAAGATIVNDISGLGFEGEFDAEMAEVVADSGAALVMMHIQGTPETMQRDIEYDDVVVDIRDYFARRIDRARAAGIDEHQIILDPGIGFGKTVDHNYRLIRELSSFFELGRPLLLGTSRKSFIGNILNKPPKERVWGTAASVACGLMHGADIVRVHDVAEMKDVVRVTEAIAGMPND